MRIMHRRIEQRPRLGTHQQRRYCGSHQIAIIPVARSRVGSPSLRDGYIDPTQSKDEFFQSRTREDPLLLATRHAGVLAIGILFGEFTQFLTDRVDGERHNVLVTRWNCRSENRGEIVDLLQGRAGAIVLVWSRAVSDCSQVGHEILPIQRGQAKIEYSIEMRHHLVVVVEATIVEIRSVEIGVAQRRRLEKTARADIMLLMIDEGAGRNMTAGTAQRRIARKRLREQCFAAPLRIR